MQLVVFWALILFQFQSYAQSSIELTCRSQAKEIAVQTYQNCVTEARSHKIEEIRKEYQAKLSELKSYYDQELKGVAGNKSESPVTAAAAPSKSAKKSLKSASQPAANKSSTSSLRRKSEIADHLPEKQVATKTMPAIQAPMESTQTVSEVPAPQMMDDAQDQRPPTSETPADESAQ